MRFCMWAKMSWDVMRCDAMRCEEIFFTAFGSIRQDFCHNWIFRGFHLLRYAAIGWILRLRLALDHSLYVLIIFRDIDILLQYMRLCMKNCWHSILSYRSMIWLSGLIQDTRYKILATVNNDSAWNLFWEGQILKFIQGTIFNFFCGEN